MIITLEKAGYPSEVKNFGSDVQDSSAYSALMHQLNPDVARFVTGLYTCVCILSVHLSHWNTLVLSLSTATI